MSETEKTLQELVADVERATREYEEASKRASAANSAECDAVNRLNEAQKALDAYVDGLRSRAPRGSDWKRPPMIRCDV